MAMIFGSDILGRPATELEGVVTENADVVKISSVVDSC